MAKYNKALIKSRSIDIATVQSQRLGRKIANPTDEEIIVCKPDSPWNGAVGYITSNFISDKMVWLPTGKTIGVGIELGYDEFKFTWSVGAPTEEEFAQ